MKEVDAIIGAFSGLPPDNFGRYLVRSGWVLSANRQGLGQVYSKADGRRLFVPLNDDAPDYGDAVWDLVKAISRLQDVSYQSILESVSYLDYHTFRNRVVDPDSSTGSMQFYRFDTASGAMFDLVRYSAAGLLSDSIRPRLTDAAKSYASMCRMGQTEVGSFVIKLLCPSKPSGLASVSQGSTFGTEAMQACLENVEFFSSPQADDPEEILPRTMNAKVASAIENMRPPSDFGSNEISVSYASEQEVGLMPKFSKVVVDKFAYSRAKVLRDRLVKSDDYEEMRLEGVITDLHQDRPRRNHEVSQYVTMEVKPNWRQLVVSMLPREYEQALKWQLEKIPIRVHAVVDKRGRVWKTRVVKAITPIPKNEADQLFDA